MTASAVYVGYGSFIYQRLVTLIKFRLGLVNMVCLGRGEHIKDGLADHLFNGDAVKFCKGFVAANILAMHILVINGIRDGVYECLEKPVVRFLFPIGLFINLEKKITSAVYIVSKPNSINTSCVFSPEYWARNSVFFIPT